MGRDQIALQEAHVKNRFSEEQIVKILAEQREGKQIKDIARSHGISENTFYNWKKKNVYMSSIEVHKLRTLEEEKYSVETAGY